MLLTAWKHEEWNRHRNRKDYFLYFQRFPDSGNIPVQEQLFRAYLDTILKALDANQTLQKYKFSVISYSVVFD